MESETYWFCLWLRRFTIKWKLHYRSHKQKRKNKPNVRFRVLGLQLVGSSAYTSDFDNLVKRFHWILSDGVLNGIGRNVTFWSFRLQFRRAYGIVYNSSAVTTYRINCHNASLIFNVEIATDKFRKKRWQLIPISSGGSENFLPFTPPAARKLWIDILLRSKTHSIICSSSFSIRLFLVTGS